jgi:hypothetical protein
MTSKSHVLSSPQLCLMRVCRSSMHSTQSNSSRPRLNGVSNNVQNLIVSGEWSDAREFRRGRASHTTRAALMHLMWLSAMRRSADLSCRNEVGMLEDYSHFSWYTNTKGAAITFFLPAAMSDCRAIASRRERQEHSEQRNGRLLTSAIMPIGADRSVQGVDQPMTLPRSR